ncbi:unnamed protein product [Gadus morhua 'NCC']
MGTLWLGLLVLLVPSQLHSLPLLTAERPGPPAPSQDEVMFAKRYLEKFYGYGLSQSDRQRRGAVSPATADDWLCAAVKQLQRYFGRPDNGRLTPDTLALMRKPRCGLSDMEPFHNTWRWKRSTLSYRISSYGPTASGRLTSVIQICRLMRGQNSSRRLCFSKQIHVALVSDI